MADFDTTVDTTSGLTEAIKSYDGIFKGMYDEELRKLFMQFRYRLAEDKWEEAKQILGEALTQAQNNSRDLRTLELVASEFSRYENNKIDANTKPVEKASWDDILKRDLQCLEESHNGLPQSIFFLNVATIGSPSPTRLVGRKLLSDLWIKNKIPELHCSFITADMILGLFVDFRITESKVQIYYFPFENPEKLMMMNSIIKASRLDSELIFPFPLIRESTGNELCSPPEGWEVDDVFDVMLGSGEERIREYTIHFMKSVGKTKSILYDPACSTGVFLSTLKRTFSDSYTIGQDLSRQMTEISRQRVDEVHCANAIDPKIAKESADYVFVRFLNSEVVKSSEASDLLKALLPTVKTSGYLVIFGHTPVLLSSANFKRIPGFKIVQCTGSNAEKSGIFQYYVLEKL